MATHTLKCWANAWDAIADGRKRFEWRRDDRGFEVGDILILRRLILGLSGYWEVELDSTPRRAFVEQRVRVTYILRGLHGVPDGYCVMSIEPEGPVFSYGADSTSTHFYCGCGIRLEYLGQPHECRSFGLLPVRILP